jgi:hypothetical protein
MRFRLSTPWPLNGGAALAPNGTIISSDSNDMWSVWARGLTPPYDATALDTETWELMQRMYPHHHHLIGRRPE